MQRCSQIPRQQGPVFPHVHFAQDSGNVLESLCNTLTAANASTGCSCEAAEIEQPAQAHLASPSRPHNDLSKLCHGSVTQIVDKERESVVLTLLKRFNARQGRGDSVCKFWQATRGVLLLGWTFSTGKSAAKRIDYFHDDSFEHSAALRVVPSRQGQGRLRGTDAAADVHTGRPLS